MMAALSGRAALVTGGGMGIGQAIAVELARQGADVVIHYAHSASGANQTLAQIGHLGCRAHAIQADLSQVEEARRVVDEAAAALGRLDAPICGHERIDLRRSLQP
jgi:NAD(P)-dependent dehydrogenase (short-subunit alcohol dehydrogenase family)